MAFLLRKAYEAYFHIMYDLSDPRADEFWLLRSPLPTVFLVFLWYKFVFEWGPKYMENRPPLNLKKIMIVYNSVQVALNGYIAYCAIVMRNELDWNCAPIYYTNEGFPRKLFILTYMYYLLKLADLLDTIFFVLRKKATHVSFLHTYHHALMALTGWIGARFLGGGHSYFLGLANTIVHTILYAYYLLTAYDSKYGKLIWLKKFITQTQLIQFMFLFYMYLKLLFIPDCAYPKWTLFIFLPQNSFMIILFSNFYIQTYHLKPKRLKEQKKLDTSLD